MNKFINKYGKIAGIVSVFVCASIIVIIFALKHGPVQADIAGNILSDKYLNVNYEGQKSLFEMNMREAIIICVLCALTTIISFIIRKKVNYK